ncbi:1-(5-phosphoribosyl)-5-[(5-phosphoribosylamino)methylideneamino]imidazole-4-carboxamide isomerase [Hippea alviniae]|uniref:1-(5-phosphoribosyl)-5-[(5- phosphoribosylamino)methylideneamino]imidazole-4- carboxamide isomerase n=1 Tax=Hippea alviniae TaxID=1279027 RepID=UPI0003B60D55|nr:1-(5-phosphoribosyl)-5-[(5-phosphoribosylamino)methylideneamino]imidazole-4-carboxamide isomerase [Hippea alviniae]
MIIIPAIDIIDGKVVRLKKGKKDDVTVYSDNPIEMIEYFNDLGIRRVHIVDLDAAFTAGKKNNRKLIWEMAKISKSMIEVGGGVRRFEDVEEILCCYVNKVILGTMPVKEPEEFERAVSVFKDKLIAGVDVENGYVKISGWQENPKIEYISFLLMMRDKGIKEAIITDITRDGMLKGIDAEFYKDIALKTDMDIIVSGGVRDINDIKKVKELGKFGVVGVIIGRAFYEKTISLEEAVRLQDD